MYCRFLECWVKKVRWEDRKHDNSVYVTYVQYLLVKTKILQSLIVKQLVFCKKYKKVYKNGKTTRNKKHPRHKSGVYQLMEIGHCKEFSRSDDV